MAKLQIIDLYAKVEDKEILKGVNLEINTGEVHAIMGPNGTGKSTLSSVIMGHPKYQVTGGDILFDGKSILDMPVDERARLGLFLAYQYPTEIPGVTNSDFVYQAMKANGSTESVYKFALKYDKAIKELKMSKDFATRYLNEGFSGGEKKRNEILQLMLLNPKIAMLDEIDSGLDVDAIQTVADVIKKLEEQGKGFLVISHYARLFDLIKPTRAIVMVNGKIVLDGDPSLIKRIDQTGYEFIKNELGISIEKEENKMNEVSIGSCAVRESIK